MELDFEKYKERLEKRKKAASPKIHSFTHEVTKEVCEYVGEPKKFGMWLGATKRVGAGQMRELLKRMKEKNITSGNYLLACTKNAKPTSVQKKV